MKKYFENIFNAEFDMCPWYNKGSCAGLTLPFSLGDCDDENCPILFWMDKMFQELKRG